AGWRGSPTGCTRWAERSLWTRRLDVRARAVRQRHRRAGVPVEGPGGRTRRARGGAAGGGRRPGGDRPADRGGAGQPGRAGRRLGARVADPAGDRGAAADGRRPCQRRHHEGPGAVGVGGREAHQLDLRKVGAGTGAGDPPSGGGRAGVPAAGRPGRPAAGPVAVFRRQQSAVPASSSILEHGSILEEGRRQPAHPARPDPRARWYGSPRRTSVRVRALYRPIWTDAADRRFLHSNDNFGRNCYRSAPSRAIASSPAVSRTWSGRGARWRSAVSGAAAGRSSETLLGTIGGTTSRSQPTSRRRHAVEPPHNTTPQPKTTRPTAAIPASPHARAGRGSSADANATTATNTDEYIAARPAAMIRALTTSVGRERHTCGATAKAATLVTAAVPYAR